jgi:UDP-N-acetyl-D-galactosamine dehydrogenase
MISNTRIAVIGLGYVGLPQDYLQQNIRLLDSTSIKVGLMDYFPVRIVLWKFRKVLQAVLLDKNPCCDYAFQKESTNHQINGLYCSATLSDIADCNYYIITVPSVDKIVGFNLTNQAKRLAKY